MAMRTPPFVCGVHTISIAHGTEKRNRNQAPVCSFFMKAVPFIFYGSKDVTRQMCRNCEKHQKPPEIVDFRGLFSISWLILESVKKLEELFIAPAARQILHETAQRAFARCECAKHTRFLIQYLNQESVSECPGAVSENGVGFAVGAVAVDGQVGRADHEVLVHHGVVDAQRAALVERFVLEILDRVGKAHAERQMAGGVLVKQGVQEEQAALLNRGVIRHERALAEVGRALVHVDELLQQRLVLLGVHLDGLAVFKADGEILDELPLIRQRLGRIDDALGLAAHRGDEDLLGGDVRVKEDPLQGIFAAALELRLGDHADAEIRAVAAVVLKLGQAQAVEIGAALGKILVVLLPRLHGVVRHARGVQNRLPERLDGLMPAQLREELLRPFLARNGRDAPLIFVLDLVAVGLDDAVARLIGLGHFFLIDALEAVGILAQQIDAAGDLLGVVLPARLLPVFQRREVLGAAPAVAQLVKGLVRPVDHDALRARAVTFLRDHRDEVRLIQLGGDEDLLPLADVHARRGDQPCIVAQNGFFHAKTSKKFLFQQIV